MDFAEAQKEALGCRKCGPLCHSRTRVVFGEGPLNAELFIVGEAPGFNEDKEGKPFRGASGMLLERLLSSVGIEREEVYLTTLVKCKPPESRPPKPAEINACRPYLLAQLAAIDPKVVVALGDLASRSLTGRKEAVSRIRGRAIPLDGRYVFPTLSLSRALYTPAERALLASDFSRLPELLSAERPVTYETLNVSRVSADEREPLQPGLW
ncbi:MAG: uracil-DNA glycosylase [Actinomycetota bacterium]|nr:uracil-DNA glycosylase [Actinomycetota bacterium]